MFNAIWHEALFKKYQRRENGYLCYLGDNTITFKYYKKGFIHTVRQSLETPVCEDDMVCITFDFPETVRLM